MRERARVSAGARRSAARGSGRARASAQAGGDQRQTQLACRRRSTCRREVNSHGRRTDIATLINHPIERLSPEGGRNVPTFTPMAAPGTPITAVVRAPIIAAVRRPNASAIRNNPEHRRNRGSDHCSVRATAGMRRPRSGGRDRASRGIRGDRVPAGAGGQAGVVQRWVMVRPRSARSLRVRGRLMPSTLEGSPSTPSMNQPPKPSRVKPPATLSGSPVAM